MKDSKVFVVIDSDGDDRALGRDPKSDFATAEEAHSAIDLLQQRGEEMRYLPWTVVERTQVVLGSYRRNVNIKFVEGAGAAFTPTAE